MQVFVIIGMLWLPDSPEFYYAKGRFDESKQVLLRIAAFNGSKVSGEQICFEKVGSSHGRDGEVNSEGSEDEGRSNQSTVAMEKVE